MKHALALAAITLLVAPPVVAQEETVPGQQRYEAAQEAFSEGDFERALIELEAAAAQAKDEAFLAEVHLMRGRCYAAIPDEPRAEAAFTQALEHDPEARLDSAKVRPSIVSLLEKQRRRLRAELKVRCDKPNAVVLLDEEKIGNAPLKRKVPIGKHWVEGRSVDGRFFAREQVLFRAGESVDLLLRLKAVARAEDPSGTEDGKPAEGTKTSGGTQATSPAEGADSKPADGTVKDGSDDGADPDEGDSRPRRTRPTADEDEDDLFRYVEQEEPSSIQFVGDLRLVLDPFSESKLNFAGEAGVGVGAGNLIVSAHGTFGAHFGATLRFTAALPHVASVLGLHLSLDAPLVFVNSKAVFGAAGAAGFDFSVTPWLEPFLQAEYRHFFNMPATYKAGYVVFGAGLRFRI